MDTRALEKRAVNRAKMVLGIRLSSPQLCGRNLVVHTLDISSSGAKVGALREWIAPGTILAIRYKHVRAQCCVIWSQTFPSGETHIGIELEAHKAHLWGLDSCAGIWLSTCER
jgi:hypothetical protein